MRYRMSKDDDAVFAIIGATGSGKSTFMRLLMRKVQDHPIQPEKQYIWNQAQILPAARELPEFSCLGIDEALAAGGNRRRAMSKDNVELMEFLNTCRTFHHATFFCAPQFGDLDTAIQTRCLGIFEIFQRGHVRYHELVKSTDVTEREVFPVVRWEDRFPDDRDHPDEDARANRAAYDELKMRFSHQGTDKETIAMREMVQRFRVKIRRILDEFGTGLPES